MFARRFKEGLHKSHLPMWCKSSKTLFRELCWLQVSSRVIFATGLMRAFGWRPPPLRSNQYEESQSTTSVSPSAAAAAAAVGSNQLNFAGRARELQVSVFICARLRAGYLCCWLRRTAETPPSTAADNNPACAL